MSHWQTVEGLGIKIHVNCDKDLDNETMEALLKMVKLAYNFKTKNMNDNVLGHLREARALLMDEKESGKTSRELSVALTEIDTAILWRQDDLRLKTPPKNEVAQKATLLPDLVFPSEEQTIMVTDDAIYGGAHHYSAKNSTGFSNGKADYVDSFQDIQFVQKNDDGSIIPGLQSEQLAIILLDRAKKLNARFPSVFNDKMILGLNMFLEACKERVEDRINRGVMGDLKK